MTPHPDSRWSLHLCLRLPFLLALAMPCPDLRAEEGGGRWTSNDGITIQARLAGWDGSRFILIKDGRDFRVPPSRLSEESLADARRALDLEAGESTAAIAIPRKVPPVTTLPPSPLAAGNGIRLEGKRAIAPAGVSGSILSAIEAGNVLQSKYYKWGGGRSALEDSGYDCSGSVSYVLIKAGLLRSPGTSRTFTRYGEPGPGRWITLYAKDGHVFMTICGLRLDTGGHGGRGGRGPRWRPFPRSSAGYVMRHPPGC